MKDDFLTVRSVVTLILYVSLAYLIIAQLPIPEYLKTLIDFLTGFYFGNKVRKEAK